MPVRALWLLVLSGLCPLVAEGLTASEILVLANRTEPDSERVAAHYVAARGVPADQVLRLDLPLDEDISRADYDRLVLPAVREVFADPGRAATIRCLLSVYGMPLRVGRRTPSEADTAVREALQPALDEATAARQAADDRVKALAAQATRTAEEEAELKDLRAKQPALRQRAEGLKLQVGRLQGRETEASLEGELAVALWPPHDLWRWVFNPLHFAFDDQPGRPPTLLCARLDAATAELARRLVDDAVATEQTGLRGTIYLDARGISPRDDPFGYGGYDESLRELAALLQTQQTMPVVLNNEPALFQPGDCPDAALYCGWYQLAHYVDAFDWVPGAVGYHIASSEARSLRQPDADYWCKKMLDDGIAATLGPVAEPYTLGFPKPYEFFVMLVSGDYTLAETYARTVYLQSWMTTLIGDPLYNPFRGRPLLPPGHLRHSPTGAPWPWASGSGG